MTLKGQIAPGALGTLPQCMSRVMSEWECNAAPSRFLSGLMAAGRDVP